MPYGQYSANDIVGVLMAERKRYGDPFCVLAVSMVDLYQGYDDLFVMGLATIGGAGCGMFSFARYVAAFTFPLHAAVYWLRGFAWLLGSALCDVISVVAESIGFEVLLGCWGQRCVTASVW
jgi:hypothetical protein